MSWKNTTCLMIALALILPAVSSLEISGWSYDFHIVGYSAYVEEEIDFKGTVTGAFPLAVPEDAEGVSIYIDGEPAEYIPLVRLDSARNIRINYVTQSVIDNGNFLASIPAKFNISSLRVTLVLEEGTSIMKEKSDGISAASVFPNPDLITSDGQSIILEWEENNAAKGDKFPIYVRIKGKMDYYFYMVIAVLLIAGWAGAKKLRNKLLWKKHAKKEKEDGKEPEKTEKPAEKIEIIADEKKEPEFLKNLKEDEKQVVRVLLMKEGSCEQGTLRIATDFSKAKLSRLLSELEDRNIVSKEKRGKKNLIFLK